MKAGNLLDENGQLVNVYYDEEQGIFYKYVNGVPVELAGGGGGGLPGPKGDKGDAATIQIGQVTQGNTAQVTNVGTATDATLDFVLPKGDKGDTGDSATIRIGNVTEGDNVSVVNVGTQNDAILDFVLKRGERGEKGDPADLAISQDIGNIIQKKDDGLYAPATPIQISQQPANIISMENDGIYAKQSPVAISTETGNIIEDKQGLYATVDISQDQDNIIEKRQDGLFARADSRTEVSPDKDNAIQEKDDGIFVQNLQPEIDKLKLFKFPNAVIYGTPTIQDGQVSDFNDQNYMAFPFIVDTTGKSFVLDYEFTTSDNVNTQQNIFDSNYGIAFAIKGSRFVFAASSNGTTWDITGGGEKEGTYVVLPDTTYNCRLEWDKNNYKFSYSTDGGQTYKEDIFFVSALSPNPTRILIGKSTDNLHPHKGIINMNYCYLKVGSELIWSGMDDAGIATRADVDLGNISESGKQVIRDLMPSVDGKLNTGLDNISGQGQTAIKDIASAYFMETKDYVSPNTPDAVKKADELSDIATQDIQDAIDKKHEHVNKDVLDTLVNDGDGTKYLADDGTYKEVNGMPELSDDGGLEITQTNELKMKSPIEVRETTQTITDYIPKATADQYGVVKLDTVEEIDLTPHIAGYKSGVAKCIRKGNVATIYLNPLVLNAATTQVNIVGIVPQAECFNISYGSGGTSIIIYSGDMRPLTISMNNTSSMYGSLTYICK